MTLRTRPHLGLRRATRLRAFYQRPPIATPGLLALYEPWRQVLNGQTGQTLFDQHGGTYDATLGSTSGADSNDPAWTGQGLDLDGIDDYLARNIGSRTLSPGELTLEVVFKIDAAPASNATILGLGQAADTDPIAWLYFNTSGNLAFVVRGGGGLATGDTSGTSYADGLWHHAALVWRADKKVRLYMDAAMVYESGATTNPITIETLGIGALIRSSVQYYGTGQIAQSAPYTRALNATEIARNRQWYKSRLQTVGINLT